MTEKRTGKRVVNELRTALERLQHGAEARLLLHSVALDDDVIERESKENTESTVSTATQADDANEKKSAPSTDDESDLTGTSRHNRDKNKVQLKKKQKQKQSKLGSTSAGANVYLSGGEDGMVVMSKRVARYPVKSAAGRAATVSALLRRVIRAGATAVVHSHLGPDTVRHLCECARLGSPASQGKCVCVCVCVCVCMRAWFDEGI
jgi:hypothetical protein